MSRDFKKGTALKTNILAKILHEGQTYGDQPYLYHLRAVVSRVHELYSKTSCLADLETIAWLHDSVEDNPRLTLDDLRLLGYTTQVIDAIDAMTKRDNETRAEYLQRVTLNQLATKVKIADARCNYEESLKTNDFYRIKRYEKTLTALGDA